MATLKIEPIETQSKGGHRVVLSGICPTEYSCIRGELTDSMGVWPRKWDVDGRVSNAPLDWELDMSSLELSELAELARRHVQLFGT